MVVILNDKEQKRLEVLNLVISSKIKLKQAAEVLGLSVRHTKRVVWWAPLSGQGSLEVKV